MSESRDVYSVLRERYKSVYRGAANLYKAGLLAAVVFPVIGVWMVFSADGSPYATGFFRASTGGLLVAGGLLVGMLMTFAASFMRALVDNTVFVAPHLSEEEKLKLVMEFGTPKSIASYLEGLFKVLDKSSKVLNKEIKLTKKKDKKED